MVILLKLSILYRSLQAKASITVPSPPPSRYRHVEKFWWRRNGVAFVLELSVRVQGHLPSEQFSLELSVLNLKSKENVVIYTMRGDYNCCKAKINNGLYLCLCLLLLNSALKICFLISWFIAGRGPVALTERKPKARLPVTVAPSSAKNRLRNRRPWWKMVTWR